jgi:hypothetical protein
MVVLFSLLDLASCFGICTDHHSIQELLNRVGVPFVDGKSLKTRGLAG